MSDLVQCGPVEPKVNTGSRRRREALGAVVPHTRDKLAATRPARPEGKKNLITGWILARNYCTFFCSPKCEAFMNTYK
jgi:hypothetical protein